MHICFLTCEYPPLPSGGIGASIRNLARSLAAFGNRVTVLGWGRSAEFDDHGVRVRFLPGDHPPKMGWLLNRLRVQRELRRMVCEEQLAVIEAPDWCGLSAGIRPGCPVVVRCHGSAVYFAHILNESVRPSVRWAEQMAFSAAQGVAAVSRFTAHLTAQLFGLQKPVRVIANGVNLDWFPPAAENETEPHVVLYFGTLVRKKGVLDLCRAFSTVAARAPHARLRLIGRDSGDRRTGSASTWSLCQKELSPQARARTEYVGAVPYMEVCRHVRRAAVCVFPSYAEALPLSWLEAMACAKPVVAYNLGWAGEVVLHGRTGLLAPAGRPDLLADEIVRLLESPAAAYELGCAGRRRVEEQFSAVRIAEASMDWYRSAIHNGHGNRRADPRS
jgi:starch synthase